MECSEARGDGQEQSLEMVLNEQISKFEENNDGITCIKISDVRCHNPSSIVVWVSIESKGNGINVHNRPYRIRDFGYESDSVMDMIENMADVVKNRGYSMDEYSCDHNGYGRQDSNMTQEGSGSENCERYSISFRKDK